MFFGRNNDPPSLTNEHEMELSDISCILVDRFSLLAVNCGANNLYDTVQLLVFGRFFPGASKCLIKEGRTSMVRKTGFQVVALALMLILTGAHLVAQTRINFRRGSSSATVRGKSVPVVIVNIL